MERRDDSNSPVHGPEKRTAKPFAALYFVLLATLALLLPTLGTTAWAELALGRRPSDSRLDPGLTRFSPLILPQSDNLRKAQSLKIQPKKWAGGNGEAAILPHPAADISIAYQGRAAFLPVAAGPSSTPDASHRPRAPPVTLSSF